MAKRIYNQLPEKEKNEKYSLTACKELSLFYLRDFSYFLSREYWIKQLNFAKK